MHNSRFMQAGQVISFPRVRLVWPETRLYDAALRDGCCL